MKEKLTLDDYIRITKQSAELLKKNLPLSRTGVYSLSHVNVISITLQNMALYTSEEKLKSFMQTELPKLTKEQFKEMYGFSRMDIDYYVNRIIRLCINEVLTNFEKQFLFIFAWKLYTFKNEKASISDMIINYKNYFVKSKKSDYYLEIAEGIDYLDYFDLNDCKKGLFDCVLI